MKNFDMTPEEEAVLRAKLERQTSQLLAKDKRVVTIRRYGSVAAILLVAALSWYAWLAPGRGGGVNINDSAIAQFIQNQPPPVTAATLGGNLDERLPEITVAFKRADYATVTELSGPLLAGQDTSTEKVSELLLMYGYALSKIGKSNDAILVLDQIPTSNIYRDLAEWHRALIMYETDARNEKEAVRLLCSISDNRLHRQRKQARELLQLLLVERQISCPE